MLSTLLFGGYRGRVLGLLLLHPEQTYHVREIARLTDASAGTLHKELDKLAQAGLLLREKIGNQLHYSANRYSPIFEELASILRKTSGLADVLREALLAVDGQISLAFIFGSVANASEHAGSDVDVLLIGDLGFGDAVRALHATQETILREINPVVMSAAEFRRRLAADDDFLSDILSKEKIFLKGDTHVLGKLAEN